MVSKGIFDRDFFELFGLSRQFFIDETLLNERYHALISRFHPDRFATASQQEKRLAVQIAAHLNHALGVLSDTLKRAHYCIQCCGVEVPERGFLVSQSFLLEQIQWREQLDDWIDRKGTLSGKEAAAICSLYSQINERYDALQQRFADEVDPCLQGSGGCEQVAPLAGEALAELQFLKKMLTLLENHFEHQLR